MEENTRGCVGNAMCCHVRTNCMEHLMEEWNVNGKI